MAGWQDVLRKAMGKKIHALLAKLKPQFIEGGKANGHDPEKLEKIWKDWEALPLMLLINRTLLVTPGLVTKRPI